jgi:hypothetical protein
MHDGAPLAQIRRLLYEEDPGVAEKIVEGLPRSGRGQDVRPHDVAIRKQAQEAHLSYAAKCYAVFVGTVEPVNSGWVMDVSRQGHCDPDVYVRKVNHQN